MARLCIKVGQRWCLLRSGKRPGLERDGGHSARVRRQLVRTTCGGIVPVAETEKREPTCPVCAARAARPHRRAQEFSAGGGSS
jgi:hypothetical protein